MVLEKMRFEIFRSIENPETMLPHSGFVSARAVILYKKNNIAIISVWDFDKICGVWRKMLV